MLKERLQVAEAASNSAERLRSDLEQRVRKLERQCDESMSRAVHLERKLRNAEQDNAELSALNDTMGSTSTAGTQASLRDTDRLIETLADQGAVLAIKSEDLKNAKRKIRSLEAKLAASTT